MVEGRGRTGLVVIAGPADEVGQTFGGFAAVEHLEVVVRYSNLVNKKGRNLVNTVRFF
jgi:hypothetical protein